MRRSLTCSAAAAAFLAVSCRDPTQVTVEISTDVPCAELTSTTVTVGKPDAIEGKKEISFTEACTDGDKLNRIGSIVIVPSDENDDKFSVKVIGGVNGYADQCESPDYPGCIVARRTMQFVPHTSLFLPITLREDCRDVPCGPSTTCVGGRCVSAEVKNPALCVSPTACDEDVLAVVDSVPNPCVISVSARRHTTCVALSDGTAHCFGYNNHGQLGDGTRDDRATPVRVGMLTNVVEVATGSRMGYALTSDGRVYGWGENNTGQLLSNPDPSESPVQLDGLSNIVHITAGRRHACALDQGGTVYCWGQNDQGQIGDGSTSDADTPHPAITDIAQVSAGSRHTCAVKKGSGAVWCWGWNDTGEIGNGQTGTDARDPVDIGFTAAEVAAGGSHTCARKDDGTAYCWGWNIYHELGDGTDTERSTPVPVQGAPAFTSLVVNGERRTCGRTEKGTFWCWGEPLFGSQGQPPIGFDEPHAPADLDGVTLLSDASYHACARQPDGQLWCAGRNDRGQLGDGTRDSRTTYKPVLLPCPAP